MATHYCGARSAVPVSIRRRLAWVVAAAVSSPLAVHAQLDPNWTLHMFNRTVLNPAFAGYHGGTNYTFAGRSQWVGLEGAPQTAMLSFSKPTPKLRGAISAFVQTDRAFTISATDFRIGYAYQIPVGANTVQIGVSGGGVLRSLDPTNFRPPQTPREGDPALPPGMTSGFKPDLGFGIAWLGRDDRFWAGVSVNHLLEPDLRLTRDIGADLPQFQLARTFGVQAGYRLRLSRNADIVPSTHLRLAEGQFQVDVNANVHINPLVFGASYRLDDAFSTLLGFQASSRLFVAYAYDAPVSRLSGVTSGSHEIVVSYTLPRFFRFSAPTLTPYDKGRRR